MSARSSLASVAKFWREPDPDEAWRIAEAAWHEHGLALFNLAEVEKRKGWVAARSARNLAEQCFGRRKSDVR